MPPFFEWSALNPEEFFSDKPELRKWFELGQAEVRAVREAVVKGIEPPLLPRLGDSSWPAGSASRAGPMLAGERLTVDQRVSEGKQD